MTMETGKLLKQIEPQHGANQNIGDGTDPKVMTRKQAASDAGMSPHQAQRIRARAIRRAGELLKQIEPGQGARDGKRGAGNHTPLRREDAAREAGMSPHQTQRIRARAIRRAGELLKQIEPATGATKKDGSGPLSRKQAANDAGMSERQAKTAGRVANVPEKDFEHLVESDKPPTVSQLASHGVQRRDPPRQTSPSPKGERP